MLILQLRFSQNQASSSKISILGICLQALLDAIICAAHIMVSGAITSPVIFFYNVALISILKLIIFGVFEIKIMILIYQSR